MPPAVNASESAMYSMVFFALATRGSRKNLHSVRDGLDAGVRAAAQRVGAQEDEEGREQPQRGRVRRASVAAPWRTRRKRGCVGEEAVGDHEGMGDDEDEEDREKERDGLFDAAEVQDDQDDEDEDLRPSSFQLYPCGGQKAEDGVAPGRDRDRDRQDVVHDQGASGNDAHARPEQLRGDEVARRLLRGSARSAGCTHTK